MQVVDKPPLSEAEQHAFFNAMLAATRAAQARQPEIIRAISIAGVRIRLRLKDAPELANYPWEYLYDRSLNWFVALSLETPVVRYVDLPVATRPLKVELPLRILAMISSPAGCPT